MVGRMAMTRDELILELKRAQAQCAAFAGDESELQRRMDAASKAYGLAVELAEQLDSPPVMAWQDEPSEHGRYYVEGWESWPILVSQFGNGVWNFVNPFSQAWCPLKGCRVCSIPAPPPLPKRGGA